MTVLEDVADNLFNPVPCYQQGGDRVRVGGLRYRIALNARMGERIREMSLHGSRSTPPGATRWRAGHRSRKPRGRRGGEPVWAVVARHLRGQRTIARRPPEAPIAEGVAGNPGLA